MSNVLNLTIYEVYQKYMFERILERISKSKYQENFILKGGLLLSAMIGIQNRTTRDMDAEIKGIDITKDKMLVILNEILSIDLNDGIKFKLIDITDIRESDYYGGNKYTLYGILGNTKVKLDIDISTGDIITPKELKYKYLLTFEDRYIYLNTYNLSTIIAEKLEIILSKGKNNSRMKDYYDVYFFLTEMSNELQYTEIKEAIINTFRKRNSIDYLNNYKSIFKIITESNYIKENWNIYVRKNLYVKKIIFLEIIAEMNNFLDNLDIKC